MSNHELLEQIKKLNVSIGQAANDAANEHNTAFYKALIQQTAIDIYQQASLLSITSSKSGGDIKIIHQEQVMEPEPMKEKIAIAPEIIKEPTVQETFSETPAAATPVNPIETKPLEKPAAQPVKPQVKHPEPAEPEQELSLNDKISKNKQPVLNVAEKSKETPIKDLVKFISIGKKFEFINGLFDGNADVYKSTLQTVQHASSYEEATGFLESNIIGPYEWDANETLAAEFFGLVKRRFLP